MKESIRLLASLLLVCLSVNQTFSQTNVRAWYRDGQVWVVWEAGFPAPDYYSVYAGTSAFTDVKNGFRLGKLHKFEYGVVALKEQLDTSATPRIPGPAGTGKYQLQSNEALFVFTPHQLGALFFAVVADNDSTVTAGQNITASAVQFGYNPVNDPVECHLQATFPSPFATGYICQAYLMWVDGRQAQWDNRPDFPVMANAAKNGAPHLFLISAPITLDTTKPFALTVWLHGGGGTARQSLAGSRKEVGLDPKDGLLLAHDDNMIGIRGINPPSLENPTWHFGWRKNYDPFTSDNLPTSTDTIVNYTQRRYIWIDEWLMSRFNIDPHRIHIVGHSMGSAGTTALAKCYPAHYASVTIFNNGFGGPLSGTNVAILGDSTQNFPTNLKNRDNQTVHLRNLFNLIDNCAPVRDWPLFRHWHSKNDDNGTMRWDAYVVENFQHTDAAGIGIQQMWSERGHGMDTGPDYNDHWIKGTQPAQNTAIDNVSWAELRYKNNQSFPAFFNHRLDPENNDPGSGLIGINNGDGDNWGAWGGYHRWDTDNIIDETDQWQVDAWLESGAVFSNDNCPHDELTADLAIRRPQQFKPQSGKPVHYTVTSINNGALLATGNTVVQADNLVVLEDITLYREAIRRVRINISDPSSGTQPLGESVQSMRVVPNPSSAQAQLQFESSTSMAAQIYVLGQHGRVVKTNINLQAGINQVSLERWGSLPAGLYLVEIITDKGYSVCRWMKL